MLPKLQRRNFNIWELARQKKNIETLILFSFAFFCNWFCASLPTGPGGVIGEGGMSNGGLIHRVGSLTKMSNGSDHDEHYRRGDSMRSSVNHHHHQVRQPSVRNGTLDHGHKRPSYHKYGRSVVVFSVTSVTLLDLCCLFETIKTISKVLWHIVGWALCGLPSPNHWGLFCTVKGSQGTDTGGMVTWRRTVIRTTTAERRTTTALPPEIGICLARLYFVFKMCASYQ